MLNLSVRQEQMSAEALLHNRKIKERLLCKDILLYARFSIQLGQIHERMMGCGGRRDLREDQEVVHWRGPENGFDWLCQRALMVHILPRSLSSHSSRICSQHPNFINKLFYIERTYI